MEEIEESGFIDDIFQWPIAKMDNYDVWYYIFKNFLTSALDQRNLLVASYQFFEPLLGEQKCSILLGPVLHVLHKHNYLDISKTELLNFRSLSTRCRESLDRSLELENPCFQNLDGMDHDICDPEHVCWLDKAEIDDARQRIRDIATRIQDVNYNNTSFQIPWECLTFPAREHENFRLILSKVGTKIHHFRYILNSFTSHWNTVYEFLFEFLGLMPNLRTLEITDISGCRGYQHRVLLELHPLPNLDHLTMLKVSYIPAVILDALLQRYADRLEKFSIMTKKIRGVLGEEMCLPRNDLLSRVTSLSQLSIGVMSTEACVQRWFNENTNAFVTLKSLSVYIHQWRENRRSTVFEKLCRILHQNVDKFSRLRTLNLFIKGGRIYEGLQLWGRPKFICCKISLNLPSVKRLWIKAYDVYVTSVDFIMGLANLEELVVNLNDSLPDREYRKEKIKFVEFWNRMEDSNIWERMPKLMTMTVRRAEWPDPAECYEFIRLT